MKRERIQFLVTCSIGYETHAERRECITMARDNLLAVNSGREARPVRATLVKGKPFRRVSLVKAWAQMEESRGLRRVKLKRRPVGDASLVESALDETG